MTTRIYFNTQYLTGQKLPLLFIEGKFTQHKYHAWLRDTAIPWLRQNWDGRNDNNRKLSYQHDGARMHTTELVSYNLSH